MEDLFGNIEYKRSNELKIVKKDKSLLSKNQQKFNKLVKRVEHLKEQIKEQEKKMSRLLAFYAKELAPVDLELANAQIQFAMFLAGSTEKYKYGKAQLKTIKEAICCLCNEAFAFIAPSEEQESFYDKWSELSYKEEEEQQAQEAKAMLSDMLNAVFGIQMDESELDEIETDPVKFEEKMKAKLEAKEEFATNKKNKNAKQIAKEEALKAEEEIKSKSIRNIYISLAKVLHPDTETDEVLKMEKEEMMKKITSAYEQKDLATLLLFELQWMNKASSEFESLSENKLKAYLQVLEEQVHHLERELFSIASHPRFEPVADYQHLTEKMAITILKENAEDAKNVIENLQVSAHYFGLIDSKKEIVDFAKSIVSQSRY